MDKIRLRKSLWQEYVWHKQTLDQLARKHKHTKQWVQRQLDLAPIKQLTSVVHPVVIIADTTFFGRGYGILVVRCPKLKRNIHFHQLVSETPTEYYLARRELEQKGYIVEAVVIDGKRGVLKVFSDLPVQLCQFHQIATVKRYLTSRPKLIAGQELRAITLTLPISTEKIFIQLLDEWDTKWKEFLKERTYADDKRHWQYTHRRIRSAYRSLRTNLPYLFTYQKYPELHIPNTTNSLDGYFSKLKQLLNTHRGLTVARRYRLIQEILV